MRWLKVCIFAALVSANAIQAVAQDASLIGQQAPRFVRSDLHGNQVDLDSFRGQVVLLNFWATWCAPCRVELPKFSAWQSQYGPDGLQVIAASMDDDSAPVRKALHKLHLRFPVVMGDAELGMKYGGILGLPVTYLIGRDGKIAGRYGGDADLKQMETRVRSLLAQR